jgi:hypothetical protein
VTIDWPDDLARVALMMEMSDRRGLAVGTWTDVDPATLTPADQCTLTSDTPTGIRILPLEGPRAVVSAIDCGQHQTTLSWIAPAQTDPLLPVQLPDAILSGAIVVSNTNGKLAGDEVASFARNLAAPGAKPVAATDVLARCETTRPHGSSPVAELACLLVLLSTLCLRARRRQRSFPHAERNAAGVGQNWSRTPSNAKRSTSRNGSASAERTNACDSR